MKPVILVFVAYYLPGFKWGGPVRSIANMVDCMGDELQFRIITKDREFLSEVPYSGVKVDEWNTVGKAYVFYASPANQQLCAVARLLRETSHDVLYLNSFFHSAFSLLPLLSRRLGLAPLQPCVIAPRGEFSSGALRLKLWKKRPYIAVTRFFGIYSGLVWHASSAYEFADISRVMGSIASNIVVAPNVPGLMATTHVTSKDREKGTDDALQVVFLSRISPKKNLDFALRVLSRVRLRVDFNIYGPICEDNYWRQCQTLIDDLPEHIRVVYHGEVDPAAVAEVLARNDLFLFPTHGENFGHVILEALSVGTPVLISEYTPWQADGEGGCTIRQLSDPNAFAEVITGFCCMGSKAMRAARIAAKACAQHYVEDVGIIEANRRLFYDCIKGRST